ncbi:MotA/TolQ/ExbB proton channel family protein [Vibrio thalassae]|nr:MotA/TolQ/ExbB proton channel family protein [Vibrio thalassae]
MSFSIISYSIIFYCSNNNKGYAYADESTNHSVYSFLVAMPITLFSLVIIFIYQDSYALNISEKFLDRGVIPPMTLFLFFWCIVDTSSTFLNSKINLAKLNKSKNINSFFSTSNMSIHTKMAVIEELHHRRFQLPLFINWSIPILGFIGTVLGISLSSENIQKVISNDDSMSNMNKGISEAIAPLGIAFDTTLIALSLGIISTFFTLVSSNSDRRYISELQVHLEKDRHEK